jgi:PhzF family phenazine biosynthesis protein
MIAAFMFFLPLLALSRHQKRSNPQPAGLVMRIPLYQVDAFTSRLFGGNPAAVCPLAEWLPDATMQAIAAENNLAETAFFVAQGESYLLRWFTPTVEVDLCGHATLASGYVVTHILRPERRSVRFDTLKAGPLEVTRDGDLLAMDFPAWPPERGPADPRILATLGKPPAESFVARGRTLAVFERAEDVAALKPDFAAMRQVPGADAIVTAPGRDGTDFVSRYFAPNYGIDEDPVTGSAHCVLTPYWAKRLGKNELGARQISARGGDLVCTFRGDRVTLAGRAVLYLEGTITV